MPHPSLHHGTGWFLTSGDRDRCYAHTRKELIKELRQDIARFQRIQSGVRDLTSWERVQLEVKKSILQDLTN
jgi:hypothetical protein